MVKIVRAVNIIFAFICMMNFILNTWNILFLNGILFAFGLVSLIILFSIKGITVTAKSVVNLIITTILSALFFLNYFNVFNGFIKDLETYAVIIYFISLAAIIYYGFFFSFGMEETDNYSVDAREYLSIVSLFIVLFTSIACGVFLYFSFSDISKLKFVCLFVIVIVFLGFLNIYLEDGNLFFDTGNSLWKHIEAIIYPLILVFTIVPYTIVTFSTPDIIAEMSIVFWSIIAISSVALIIESIITNIIDAKGYYKKISRHRRYLKNQKYLELKLAESEREERVKKAKVTYAHTLERKTVMVKCKICDEQIDSLFVICPSCGKVIRENLAIKI